jgi:putative ATPase
MSFVSNDQLFADEQQRYAPLAARMRPQTIDGYFGQQHLLGDDKPLRRAITSGILHSMIFWGPPGVGKTTLARMLANATRAEFLTLSAVMSGVKEIREAIQRAQFIRQQSGRATVLFIDEVHRFNKSQQDAFLPFVEDGTVVFVGATTENPSFELNGALLSRARVYKLQALTPEDLKQLLSHALEDKEQGLAGSVKVSDEQLERMARAADGDARRALNILEISADLAEDGKEGRVVTETVLDDILRQTTRHFDKGGDIFYEQISALHKAVRGSHPDAALYWMVRMIDGGCDPLYVARRVVRMANEDIGLADPRAMQIALNAWDVQERLGHPEGELAIAQAVVYMACAPKSNAVYMALKAVKADIQNQPSYDVPVHLRNAPTKLMKNMGYGGEYRYAHDEPNAYAAGENYLPEEIKDSRWYEPTPRGLEGKIAEKLQWLRGLDLESGLKRYRE